ELERRVGVAQALAHGPAEKALEHGQAPIGARRRAAGMTRERVLAQVALARIEQGAAVFAREPGGEQRQVAPIRGERVCGEALLDPERVDEAVDRRGARCLDFGAGRHGARARGPSRGYSSLSFCAATTFL